MRITIQALIEGVAGGEQRAETIGVVERDADCVPASGIGLFTSETPLYLLHPQTVTGARPARADIAVRPTVHLQRLDEETQLAVRAIVQAQQRTEQDKSRKAQLRVGSSSSP